jgi:hypothetical protein
LRSTPRELGWVWDVKVGNPNTSDFGAEDDAAVANDALVAAAVRVADLGEQAAVNGSAVTAAIAGIDVVKGTVGPRVLRGRLPTGMGEVALGHRTMKRASADIGRTVTLKVQQHEQSLRVVGEILGNAAINTSMSIGDGAVVTVDQGKQLLPDHPVVGNGYLLKLRPGVTVAQAMPELQRTWGRTVLRSLPPTDVQNIIRVRSLPLVLAALVGTAAAMVLAFVLLLTVRHRRHELAVLKALGATGRQVRASLAWQATTVVAIAAIVGVPLGAVTGRAAWRAIATDLGAISDPRTPALIIMGLVVGAFVLGNLIAMVPARSAARTPAAAALRTE